MLEKRKNLIDFLIKENGKDNCGYTWSELLEMFEIEVTSQNLKRASDWWRYYQSTNKIIPTEELTIQDTPEATPNLVLKKMWVTPEGKIGKSYVVDNTLPINAELTDLFYKYASNQQFKFDNYSYNTNVDETVIVLSDIHVGAINGEYSIEQLEFKLSTIIKSINSDNSKKHIIFPGDLIESFTGLNHPDSWKGIEAYGSKLVIIVYEVLKSFLSNINNLGDVIFVEGNHDRITSYKEESYREGVVKIISYMLSLNNSNVYYDPFQLGKVIDNFNYLVLHGDITPFKKSKDYSGFLFEYGRQGMFNIIITGHYHEFKILDWSKNHIHIQAPSVVSGDFYGESRGLTSIPGYLKINNINNKPKITFEPL